MDTKVEVKYKRRRCPNGKDSESNIYEGASRGSSEAGNGRRTQLPEVGRRLSVSPSTIRYWVRANKEGKLKEVGKQQRPLTEIEMELARVKRELAEVRMERDILKKATAYFAKESLPGTRT